MPVTTPVLEVVCDRCGAMEDFAPTVSVLLPLSQSWCKYFHVDLRTLADKRWGVAGADVLCDRCCNVVEG